MNNKIMRQDSNASSNDCHTHTITNDGHNNIAGDPEVTDISGSIQRTLYSGGDQGVVVDHYRVEGGDHVWFEQDFGGSLLTERVWDFFEGHDLNGARGQADEQ